MDFPALDLPKTPADLYDYERRARAAGFSRVAGIDEAGRGPLAGPVVVAAVCLPPDLELPGVNDSKQLTEARREVLYDLIMGDSRIQTALRVIPASVVDRMNIYQATVQGMREVAVALLPRIDLAFIDGKPVRAFPVASRGVVKGDGKVAAIAAASILSKVHRDRLMLELHARYPEYGFDRHKGYGTAVHLAALAAHGPCPEHRRSFAPVAACLDGPPAAEQGEFSF